MGIKIKVKLSRQSYINLLHIMARANVSVIEDRFIRTLVQHHFKKLNIRLIGREVKQQNKFTLNQQEAAAFYLLMSQQLSLSVYDHVIINDILQSIDRSSSFESITNTLTLC